ncbi:helix-turn-helix domain-containing protein [Pseudoalteromonas denitrificans]|uniref:Cro/C1-type HTH DNA-binding domain-containing protein n=1 Tax=Pseudoalteromonas denitrificans DSM 6059 TaxID=1123010 RepID=A0A1I1PZ14_9GAMM|nr:helix-turn-helix domain-containing protein [Pseudoalteromonas denitrificans]SFD14957.1 Cro/C1-type HTH DNA-binding domain-containing protein [Pseudoalteromonas denitrificans DSM 6059]
MSQIIQISNTLKQLLRQQQVTYKHIAKNLDMSEANIKRIFSTNSFTLERLEDICALISMSLSDLFLIAQKQNNQLTQLTIEQEQELVADTKLFLVAACVRDSWTFSEIVAHYKIDEFQCIRLMAKLDKLKMIQLLPDNNYKLLIAQDFRWIKNGPLERFMEKDVIAKFMSSTFDATNSFRFYLRGTYSQSSIDIIQRKLNQLTKEAAILNQDDAVLPLNKRQHVGLLLAMRPWELSLFKDLKR